MLNLLKKLIISSCLITSISPVFASVPLTTVELPIANQEEQQISPLLSQGLTTVVTRLTGNPKIAEQKAVADILNQSNDYIENYSQQANPDRLVMSFDQRSIESALSKANIGYWSSRRPLIMTWWLNETKDSTSLIGDGQPSTKIITSAAETQGFPLIFPLADLNEQALVKKENFTANPPTALLQGSKQYMPNAILIVYMLQKDNDYQANWQLWLSNDETKPLASAQVKGTSQQQIANQIFSDINPVLANVFIVKGNNTTENLDIVINGLDFSRYVEVNNLMNSFDGKVVETTGSTVHYQIKANPAQIEAQLNLLHFTLKKEDKTASAELNKTTTLVFQPSN